MKKSILVLAALVAAFAIMITGCGAKESAEPAAEASLGLQSWEMSATTWSSPNGATVHVSAVPNAYAQGQEAVFSIRLEGDDVENVPCEWNGTAYTASADLNAADGYCYYVVLTQGSDSVEVAVNTPAAPTDETLVNMETALNSFCHLLVESSDSEGSKLTITGGTVQIQAPQITNDGQQITCTQAALVLSFNGEEAEKIALTLPAPGDNGIYEMSIADITFQVPEMEDDQQLTLRLDVTLSNGQTLTDANGTWSYMDGQLLSAVG